jgi:hypothetical protein
MRHPVVKRLRITGIVAAIAVAVLAVCLLSPLAFPAQWRETLWRSWHGGSEMYVVSNSSPAGTLRYGFTYEPVGRYIRHATRVTIEIDEQPPWTGDGSSPARDGALQRLRVAFIKDCNDGGVPELAGLFETAWESPGHTTVYEYPNRRFANAALWVAAVTGWLAATVLATAIVAALWFVPQWFTARRRSRHGLCVHCGYDLSGIGGGRCPECGK